MATRLGAWLKTFFGGNMPTVRDSAGGILSGLLSGPTTPRRGTPELLAAYSRLPWLHAVVQRIAQDVARTRWRMYRTSGSSLKSATRRAFRTMRRGWLGYAPEGAVVVESHPFLDVLADPNPLLSPISTWWIMQGLLDVKGECPVILERAGDGAPLELWPVPPHWLVESPTAQRPTFRFQAGTWHREVPAADVMFLRHPSLEHPYQRGSGTAEAAADELDIDEFAARHLKSFFYNRALPDAFVTLDGYTRDDAIEFEDRLRAKHQGIGKGNGIHVTNGKLDVKTIGATFRESQIVELRGAQRDLFLQLFSIPPEVMGIVENSNRATIDASDYLYQKNVICPRLDFLADSFTKALGDPSLVVGYESPIPADDEFNLKVMVAQPTLFTKNEWRSLAGAPTRPKWDDEFPSAPAPTFGAAPVSSTEPDDDEEADGAEPVDDTDEADDEQRRSLHGRQGVLAS